MIFVVVLFVLQDYDHVVELIPPSAIIDFSLNYACF